MTGFSGNHPAIILLHSFHLPDGQWADITWYLSISRLACRVLGLVCQCILCMTSSWGYGLGPIKQAIDQMTLKVNCWAAERQHQEGVIIFEWCIWCFWIVLTELNCVSFHVSVYVCVGVSAGVCFLLGCIQCFPLWVVWETEQPGITGVFSRVEIHNMVISLENRMRIIGLKWCEKVFFPGWKASCLISAEHLKYKL